MAKAKTQPVNHLGAEILVRHLARRDAPWLPLTPRELSHCGNIWIARQSSTVVTYGDQSGASDAERQANARATARIVKLGLLQRSGKKYSDVITPAGERYARNVGWPFLASQTAEALARLAAMTDAGDCTYQRGDGPDAPLQRQGFVYAPWIAGSASDNALDCLDLCFVPFARAGLLDATGNGSHYRLAAGPVTAKQIAAIVPVDADRNYDAEFGAIYFDQLAIARQRILDEPQEINELGGFPWNLGPIGSSRKPDDFRGAEPIFPKPMPGETNSLSGDVAA